MQGTFSHQKHFWVWMDLEMTGLNDKTCTILQIATIITDEKFNEIDCLDMKIWHPEETLSRMSPFVRQMHTDNGLLNQVRSSPHALEDAERKTLQMISDHVPHKKGILAGNSIWQDRRFLLRYMPNLENYLHYRMIDVSAIKTLSHAWFKEKDHLPRQQSAHTALEDIRHSIHELKFYRERYFKSEIFISEGLQTVNG